MNELTAAVARAQLKKTSYIKEKLHQNKKYLKRRLSKIKEIEFREILDEQGEVGTLITFFLPSTEKATELAAKFGTPTITESGWHVYNNMEHFLDKKTVTEENCPFSCPFYKGSNLKYNKGMLPKTDNLLNRAINISIGVSDKGLGSAFGIRITSTKEEIEKKADILIDRINEVL